MCFPVKKKMGRMENKKLYSLYKKDMGIVDGIS